VKVRFSRIGRHRSVPVLELPDDSSESYIAEQVYRFCKPKLSSREFAVSVEGDAGTIEWGRFGDFTIDRTPESTTY